MYLFFEVGDNMAIYTLISVFLSSFIPLMFLFSAMNKLIRVNKTVRLIL